MILKAENLSIGFREKAVFCDINFSASEGELIALLGVNGIGKSTLLRTVAGLLRKVSGTIQIEDKEIETIPALERAKLISIVLTERLFIDNISVWDFISLARSPYTSWMGILSEKDKAEIERVISLMKLSTLQSKMFNHLSDGEKQKVMLARALCQQTPLVILDEPTAFLDFRNKKEILDVLTSICSQMNKTIILSSHDIEAILEHCTKAWLMTEDKQFIEIKKEENFKEKVSGTLFESV